MDERINKVFEILAVNIKNPHTELVYSNTFTLLVAVILSARSTDVGVNKVTQNFLPENDTPEKILSLGEEKLISFINKIGLFKNKARNIIKTCHILVEKFDSSVPLTLEELITLPGVGRKTANVILNTITKAPVMPVDTHVYRVSRRLNITKEHNILKVERDLMNTIPKKWLPDAANLLVLHGRYICKAIKPRCDICSISDYCPTNYLAQTL